MFEAVIKGGAIVAVAPNGAAATVGGRTIEHGDVRAGVRPERRVRGRGHAA